MKYSNDCRRLAHLILIHRDAISLLGSSSPDPIKQYKDLLIDLTIQDPLAKEKVVELLKYQHHLDEAKQLSEWTLPRFPVTGGMLASKGIKQGPQYKLILHELREAWKNSHFQATENQLLDEILPNVLVNLPNSNQASSKSSSTSASLPKKRKQNP